MTFSTRDADDRVLDWIRLRSEGVTCISIARYQGVSRQLVSAATDAVRKADIEHCGPEATQAYW